jgi:glycosyltransferase involved in cell wall biosynthesis
MAHGVFPREYISNPHVSKPIEAIYADLNSFTWELFREDSVAHQSVDFTVVLPPLYYDGRFVKGLFFSRGVDYILECLPHLRDLFTSMAYTMFCSYPWANAADAYLACYRNPARQAWYKKTYPDRSRTVFIPLADTDFMDEYRMSPRHGVVKNIDVLCVSRLQDVKNITMISRALKVYRSKYGRRIRMTLVTGHKGGVATECLPAYAREQLTSVRRILGRVESFMEILGFVDHWTQLPEYYSRAKVYVLGSLIEGKNRSIGEALGCNVPVVCFQEFNQYARQGYPILPDGAGLHAIFDPESLADAIHTVLHNERAFSPRLAYLRRNGRRNFLNQCLDSIPHYRKALPHFVPGQHVENAWIDAALHKLYHMELHSFLYRPGPGRARAWGIPGIKRLVQSYRDQLGM